MSESKGNYMKKCPKCGFEVNDNYVNCSKCGNCGHKITDNTDSIFSFVFSVIGFLVLFSGSGRGHGLLFGGILVSFGLILGIRSLKSSSKGVAVCCIVLNSLILAAIFAASIGERWGL